MKRLTTADFIERARIKHSDKYVYDKSIYTSAKCKLIIKCKLHGDFEKGAFNHLKGVGCPKCSKENKVLMQRIQPKGQSFAEVYPDIAKQWHPTKNGELTPFMFSKGSNKMFWWKCNKGDDHEWKTSINKRNGGSGCTICSGYKKVKSNCLRTTHPDIADQWHPTKNGELITDNIVAGSNKKGWWKCPEGDDHEWEAVIASRALSGRGCPVCINQKIVTSNCLATTHPEIANQWHPKKNGSLTPVMFGEGSNKNMWWKCPEGDDHEWFTKIVNRVKGQCPVCCGQKVVKSNCLATTHPDIVEQWHPTKNGSLTTLEVTYGSEKRVWWKCDKGDDHEWLTSPNHRSSGTDCPICSGHKIVKSNCLATLYPKLSEEWHPTKNGKLTAFDVGKATHKKVWWKCKKSNDHEWLADISPRTLRNVNCPFCTLTPQSRQELTITFELIQFFKDINPKGFKTRVKGKLWSIDIYIPQLKLGIEFDGSYWHKDKRALDKLKTEKLEEEGFEIFRVREEPLKRIFDDDIMSKQPFNAKQVANDILTQIMSRYSLDAKKIAKIESYIAKKELQNEKGLDKYIDMILTEKAEKKK